MDNLVSVSLREKGGWHYAVFYDPDRGQKWRTLRTRDRREAGKRVRIAEDLVSRGEYDPWRAPVPDRYALLAGAVAEYVAERERGPLSPATVRADKSLLGALVAHLPPAMKVRAVGPDRVEGFLRALVDGDRSDNTIRTYHVRMSHFFKWCADRKLIRASPMADVARPRPGEVLARFLSEPEFDRLLQAVYRDADEKARGIVDGERSKHTALHEGDIVWLADVFCVAVETGMRLAELCNMSWDWVDVSGRSVWIPSNNRSWSQRAAFRTKSGKGRRVAFGSGSATEAVFLRLAEGGGEGFVFKNRSGSTLPLNGTYVSKRFKDIAKKAKLSPAYTFHTLRHTCASWMVMAGRHLVEVQEQLGHASIDTTVRYYAHLDPARLNQAADAVFGGGARRLHAARAFAGPAFAGP